jgi:peroxiredoxin
MNSTRCALILAFAVFTSTPLTYAKSPEQAIIDQMQKLRSVPPDQRPAETIKIAGEIRALPAGVEKVKLADALSHLATEGDPGQQALQTVTDTLGQALTESPVAAKTDRPPMPYLDLAKLVRYEHVTATLNDPQYAKATQVLADNEADIAKADFTLKDLDGKKVTFSQLRGKIVMVSFWATWCGPCRLEMPALDKIYAYYQPQGLVVLSITDEELFKVGQFITAARYRPPVLLDPDGKVHKIFHIEGIPRTFLFDRQGKLVDVAIDQRTPRQFLEMLTKTDLHP